MTNQTAKFYTGNGAQLYTFAHKNETSEIIAKALKERDRMRHTSDLRRFKTDLKNAGNRIIDEHFEKFFVELEKMGFGSYIVGRRDKKSKQTNPDRFNWFYSLKDLGRAMVDGADTKILALTKRKETPDLTKVSEEAAPTTEVTTEVTETPAAEPTMLQNKPKVKLRKKADRTPVAAAKKVERPLKSENHVFIFLKSGRALDLHIPSDLSVEDRKIVVEALTKSLQHSN